METKEVKRIKVINWTETLRQMSVGDFLMCDIEEKELIAPKAYTFKGRRYAINKNSETKQYKVTRLE